MKFLEITFIKNIQLTTQYSYTYVATYSIIIRNYVLLHQDIEYCII